ncbi:MAG: hypothetical protein H6822_02905 [Planctomycetaceae bacterium]|nr:hypothetical protein [Planctomycetales bacterium]MCB9921101.1 hypothetical protein [Planctomycetaceae bacterium]
MSPNRYISVLLATTMVAQSVIAGWGHSHAHTASGSDDDLRDTASHGHHHAVMEGEHGHAHDGSHEHPHVPDGPDKSDDCTICRHLALAAIFALDLEDGSVEQACEAAHTVSPLLLSITAVGLHRPRSPPEQI